MWYSSAVQSECDTAVRYRVNVIQQRGTEWMWYSSAAQSECDSINPLKKMTTFPLAGSHETHQISTVLCADLSYWILRKSGKKVGNDGHTFAYTPSQSAASIKSIFKKFLFAREVCVKKWCIGFHENPTDGWLTETRWQRDRQTDWWMGGWTRSLFFLRKKSQMN